jgi:hypothetical protein
MAAVIGNRRAVLTLSMSLALLPAMVFPIATHATDLGFLKNAAIANFDKEDVDLMMKNVNEVLESESPGAKQEWSNPKSGASGVAQVKRKFTATDGSACKLLRLTNSAKGVEGKSTFTFCKYEGRGWLFNPDAKPMEAS